MYVYIYIHGEGLNLIVSLPTTQTQFMQLAYDMYVQFGTHHCTVS